MGKLSSLNKTLRFIPSISESNLRSTLLVVLAESSLLTLIGEEISSWFLREISSLQGKPCRNDALELEMENLEKLRHFDEEATFSDLMKHSGT